MPFSLQQTHSPRWLQMLAFYLHGSGGICRSTVRCGARWQPALLHKQSLRANVLTPNRCVYKCSWLFLLLWAERLGHRLGKAPLRSTQNCHVPFNRLFGDAREMGAVHLPLSLLRPPAHKQRELLPAVAWRAASCLAESSRRPCSCHPGPGGTASQEWAACVLPLPRGPAASHWKTFTSHYIFPSWKFSLLRRRRGHHFSGKAVTVAGALALHLLHAWTG